VRRANRSAPVPPSTGILPGGRVKPTDASLEDALHREVHEELAGKARVHSLIHIFDGTDDRQFIFLARIDTWSFDDRSGPEFAEAGRGTYELDLVPFTPAGLAAINLKPDAIAQFLAAALDKANDPFDLPDL
jgi:8-oxo-dGTP pyrophosphatase MutT (NUDIX family)